MRWPPSAAGYINGVRAWHPLKSASWRARTPHVNVLAAVAHGGPQGESLWPVWGVYSGRLQSLRVYPKQCETWLGWSFHTLGCPTRKRCCPRWLRANNPVAYGSTLALMRVNCVRGPDPRAPPLESSHGLPELLSCLAVGGGGGVYSVGLDTSEHPRKEWYSKEALGFSSLPWY